MPQSSIITWLNRGRTTDKGQTREVGEHDVPHKQNSTTEEKVSDSNQSAPLVAVVPTPIGNSLSTPNKTESDEDQKLPNNVFIVPCQEQYIASFRRLNSILLPIPYSDHFYREILQDAVVASLARVALWHDKPLSSGSHENPEGGLLDVPSPAPGRVVAGIRCRLIAAPPGDPQETKPTLYISTLGTLAPFRQHGIAHHLLFATIRAAIIDYGIQSVTAHVWEANEEALKWYQKRGFSIVRREEGYYRRLAPQSAAWVIKRDVQPNDLLSTSVTWKANSLVGI